MKPDTVQNAWAKDLPSLFSELGSHEEKGLSEKEAKARLATYGQNTFGEGRSRSPLWLFLQQFNSPLVIILLISGIVTLIFHEWVDSIFVFLAVAVATGLGFYQEYKAERATETLKSYIEVRSRVIRENQEEEIDARTLVPGDIVLLRAGERVPADGRVLTAHDLSVDESVLTGESLP